MEINDGVTQCIDCGYGVTFKLSNALDAAGSAAFNTAPFTNRGDTSPKLNLPQCVSWRNNMYAEECG
jgi:hypothetical protein